MGCSCSKFEVLAEEKMIMSSEDSIGFNMHTSSKIDMYFRKYSMRGSMTPYQLQACFEELSIDISDSIERIHVKKFINSFIKFHTVNYKKLLIYGILCGKANKEEKAELLFQLYDHECNFVISKEDMVCLINDIFSVSLKRCMYLFTSLFTLKEHINIIKKYIYKCQTALPYCKSEAIKRIVSNNEQLDYETYKTRLIDYKNGALLDTSQLRMINYNYYILKKPQKPVNLTLKLERITHSRKTMEKFTLNILKNNQTKHSLFNKNPNFSSFKSSPNEMIPPISTKRSKSVETKKPKGLKRLP